MGTESGFKIGSKRKFGIRVYPSGYLRDNNRPCTDIPVTYWMGSYDLSLLTSIILHLFHAGMNEWLLGWIFR